jgi:hypothetical protein
MTLHGVGREPVGVDQPIRYDDVNSPAITHRYDLYEADPKHPDRPKVDPSSVDHNHYAALDTSVATIDHDTGRVNAGRGSHSRTFAVATLSVGDKVTTYPLVFEPRKNYLPPKPVVLPPAPLPPLHVAAAAPQAPPSVGPINAPPLPSPGPPAATPTTPPVAPPAPPAPPPPSFGQALPLSLSPKLTPVSFSGSVVPPSPPPVNPAPPSGSAAKKEAKQRQAATAKSEEGGGGQEAANEAQQGGDNGSMSMTRRKNEPLQYTARVRNAQPSAWSRDLLYGGGLIMGGLVLALGWTTVRPTPRRRQPTVPAPAWARTNRPRR